MTKRDDMTFEEEIAWLESLSWEDLLSEASVCPRCDCWTVWALIYCSACGSCGECGCCPCGKLDCQWCKHAYEDVVYAETSTLEAWEEEENRVAQARAYRAKQDREARRYTRN